MNGINASSNGQRCNIIILSITLFFILAIVITGVCVRFLLEGNIQRIILITLICILAVLGMTAVIILEIRRRRAMKRKPKVKNVTNIENKRSNYRLAPTAPRLSDQSSWHYSKNYSNRTTFQA